MLAWTRVEMMRVEKESDSRYKLEGNPNKFASGLNMGHEGSKGSSFFFILLSFF